MAGQTVVLQHYCISCRVVNPDLSLSRLSILSCSALSRVLLIAPMVGVLWLAVSWAWGGQ